MVKAYLSFGSNQQNPIEQVSRAIRAVALLPDTQLIATSSLYTSQPLGPADQPHFINAVAGIQTTLSAENLLQCLQHIEQQQGRVRGAERWGPRTIDCDILLYGEQTIKTDVLTIPHYDLAQREFVLIPLLEIAPDLKLPNGECIHQLLSQCPRQHLGLIKMKERVIPCQQ